MKTSLFHLPSHKQEELRIISNTILTRVPAEMIILFGSYARGEWVEDYQERSEYVSDFDILVVTGDRLSAKQGKKWWDLSKELADNTTITRTSIIQHSIGFINDKIERNQYFFIDILKDGVLLFDSGKFRLSKLKALSGAERHKKAQEQFFPWYESASRFLEGFEIYLQKGEDNPGYYKEAAFLLHQATERLYATILLVFTDYKPKIHDIEILGSQSEKLHSDLVAAFPKNTSEQKRMFQLLQKAYIDSRYDLHYKIEKADLKYLGNQVKLLKDITHRICIERIDQFSQNIPL